MKDRAIILARASTEKQAIEGDTLDDQVRLCSQFIIENGWEQVKIFPLVESGRKEERKYFEEVLEYCENRHNNIKYVIFKNISRFTRGGSEAYFPLKKRLSDVGVMIRDIHGTIRPNVNTMARFGLKYTWSEHSPSQSEESYEANKARDNAREALSLMIGAEVGYTREGYWSRRPPYGFANQKIETIEDGKRNILIPHPVESEFMKTIYQLRADGVTSDKEIVDQVNSLGFKSREFHRRDRLTKKIIGKAGKNRLTVKRMQTLITRPIYAGLIYEAWTLFKPVKAKFEGLVSIETFNQANRGKVTILSGIDSYQIKHGVEYSPDKVIKRRSKDNPLYPFKNAILCPLCGGKIHGSASTGAAGKKFPAYHHNYRTHKYWRVPKAEFEETVYSFIKKIHFSPDLLKLFEATVLEVWKDQRVDLVKKSQLAEQTVSDLLARQGNTLESIKLASSELVRKALEVEYESLEDQIKLARDYRVSSEKSELDVKGSIKQVVYLMEHLEELLIDTSNPLQQRQLFGLIFDGQPTYDELANGTAKLTPVFALNTNQNIAKSALVTL